MIALYILGALALAAGCGIVAVALLSLEKDGWSDDGRVSPGYMREQGWSGFRGEGGRASWPDEPVAGQAMVPTEKDARPLTLRRHS